MKGELTALVVDDSRLMRYRIMEVLEAEGFDIIDEAKNGVIAVERYRELHPGLVTMDIVMPKMHGIEALKAIFQQDPDARIIVISGLHQRSLLMEALEAGALDYLIKPFSDEELRRSVQKAMAQNNGSASGDERGPFAMHSGLSREST